MPGKKKKRAGVSRAEALRIAQRVDQLVPIRLRGAAFWDVREFVREEEGRDGSPWKLPARGKPLSDSQLRRYVARADAAIRRAGRVKRSNRISTRYARTEMLYAETCVANDWGKALACLQEQARQKGDYPAARLRVKHTGAAGFRFVEDVVDGSGAGPAAGSPGEDAPGAA